MSTCTTRYNSIPSSLTTFSPNHTTQPRYPVTLNLLEYWHIASLFFIIKSTAHISPTIIFSSSYPAFHFHLPLYVNLITSLSPTPNYLLPIILTDSFPLLVDAHQTIIQYTSTHRLSPPQPWFLLTLHPMSHTLPLTSLAHINGLYPNSTRHHAIGSSRR